jgi:hypothetical protein
MMRNANIARPTPLYRLGPLRREAAPIPLAHRRGEVFGESRAG